jgi:predicted Zn-dependent peptidase
LTASKSPALLAAAAIALLSSCASRPAAPRAPAVSAQGAAIVPGAAAAPAVVERAPPAKGHLDYLDASLADYRRETLPNGAVLAVKRQAGRKTAAARILLARDCRAANASEAGYDALALSTAARSAAGSEPGSVERAAAKAGASIELRLDDCGDAALELLCPSESMASLLGLVARALASPAFASEDFGPALREARVAERREAGDPLARASSELRGELYRGRPEGLPPRGTAASLAAATRDKVMRYWSSHFGSGRLSIVVVGDFEPEDFARELELPFGAIAKGASLPLGGEDAQGGSQRSRAPMPPIHPWFKALPLSGTPGQALLRGEFGAPGASSPDYPAMTVALAMLDDLLIEVLGGGGGLGYSAWTSLSAAAAPSASLTVYRTGDPAAAKAAVDGAIADIARGLCVDATSAAGGIGPIERSLEAYKSRAMTSIYAKSASSEGMAARIARDLASGGDGTALFRMSGRIAAVKAEDVVRVARERLLEGPSAWVALGDPELVLGLSSSAFVPLR